jgi:hypothetical protein
MAPRAKLEGLPSAVDRSLSGVFSERLASARCRLAESRLLCECDVIFEVVRTRSVHEGGYGHNRVRSAA